MTYAKERQEEVRRLYEHYVQNNKSNAYEVAQAMSNVLGGLTQFNYEVGKRCRLYNHAKGVNAGLNIKGLSRRQNSRLEELARQLYVLAETGEGFSKNSVNLGKKKGKVQSTKHYKKAFSKAFSPA